MAYDERLAGRFRAALAELPDVVEKRMMGGVCFLSNGNMVGGVDRTKEGRGRFMFRVGREQMAEAMIRPGAEAVEMGGHIMSGFVFVGKEACGEEVIKEWVSLALHFVSTLPPKQSA